MAFCLVHLQRHFANPEEDYPKPIVDHEAASKARCLEPSDKLDILQMSDMSENVKGLLKVMFFRI